MPQYVFYVTGTDAHMVEDLAKEHDDNISMAVRLAVKQAWERRFKNGNGAGK